MAGDGSGALVEASTAVELDEAGDHAEACEAYRRAAVMLWNCCRGRSDAVLALARPRILAYIARARALSANPPVDEALPPLQPSPPSQPPSSQPSAAPQSPVDAALPPPQHSPPSQLPVSQPSAAPPRLPPAASPPPPQQPCLPSPTSPPSGPLVVGTLVTGEDESSGVEEGDGEAAASGGTDDFLASAMARLQALRPGPPQ